MAQTKKKNLSITRDKAKDRQMCIDPNPIINKSAFSAANWSSKVARLWWLSCKFCFRKRYICRTEYPPAASGLIWSCDFVKTREHKSFMLWKEKIHLNFCPTQKEANSHSFQGNAGWPWASFFCCCCCFVFFFFLISIFFLWCVCFLQNTHFAKRRKSTSRSSHAGRTCGGVSTTTTAWLI